MSTTEKIARMLAESYNELHREAMLGPTNEFYCAKGAYYALVDVVETLYGVTPHVDFTVGHICMVEIEDNLYGFTL